ncbi:serine hydrolase domain-containing protein [Streptomyces pseudovenezuelae]|uniref:Beta-lactamase family protein n=1 Tax=Streptomyces pseudovenezuelae TaxID=67350 RepID=A0ABZ1X7K8_9ACTN|nr:serine hydrolase domain-containing protein [Streptomyces pseudovenezuelae]
MSLRRSRLRAASVLAVCLTALSSATAGAATGPSGDPTRSGGRTLQRQLDDFVHRSGGPPGAIAVLRTEQGTRVVRAGVADVRTGRPPRPDDHMRIASTAKAFSGAVALTLVDRHALRLDDTLGKRLPRLPKAWRSVTLRQLLQHTSGLPDYSRSDGFLDELRADPHHHFDSRRLLDYVADEPLLFEPGTQYRYSNSDNIAVALMAEAATRTPYEDLLREFVYAPLRLHSTSLPQGYRMPRPYLHGYDVSTPGSPEDVSEVIGMSGVWASGGIVSTPADMTRFIRGYAGGRLYAPSVVEQQRQWVEGASEPAGPGRNSAGLAVFRYETRCGVVLGHTGNTLGYTQLIAATPDGRRSLTFSVTAQITQSADAEKLRDMRAIQENFVCALLHGKNQ